MYKLPIATSGGGATIELDEFPFTVYQSTRSISGATNATPIAITSTAHGLSTGNSVTIAGVGGNTAANGTWTITVTGADTFTLDTSVGNGTYTSGGTLTSPKTWRNVRVLRGTVNTIHPDFDDSFDPTTNAVDILLAESLTDGKVWIECDIDITEGVTQGNVTAAILVAGEDPTILGWSDFPQQPDGNATTGQPADKFFILLADGITTTTDAGTATLTIPTPQNVRANQWLDLVAFDMFCDSPNGEKLRRRMSRRSVL